MKTIEYNGRLLNYKISDDFLTGTIETNFYEGYEIIERKKYIIFGDIIKFKRPKFLFSLNIDVENSGYTKNYIKNSIYNAFIDLANETERKNEVKNGKIVL